MSSPSPGQTVNKEYYLNVLHQLRDAIWWKRPQLWAIGDLQLPQHNVPTHASLLMHRFLVKHHITQLKQAPTAQIWCPVTSGFSQNKNHLWKWRYVRPSMRFRIIPWDSWWWFGDLCEVPRCLLWRGLRCHCPIQCFLYLVSSRNDSIFHIIYLDTMWRDLILWLKKRPRNWIADRINISPYLIICMCYRFYYINLTQIFWFWFSLFCWRAYEWFHMH